MALQLYQTPTADSMAALQERVARGASQDAPQPGAWLYQPDGPAMLIQVRLSETHHLHSELAEQTLENGAVVSDHLILRPRTLAVVYEQPNGFNGADIAHTAWESVRGLWAARTLLNVITEHDLYTGMVIEHVAAIHEAPYLGRLGFTIQLKKVPFAQWNFLAVTPKMLAGGTDKTASTKNDIGLADAFKSDKNAAPTGDFLLKAAKSAWPRNNTLVNP